MQSFLQYRRFGKHVRRQYERDQEKARALGQHDSESPSRSHASQPSNLTLGDNEDSRDLEKGEEYNRTDGEGVNTVVGEGINTGDIASPPVSRPVTPQHEIPAEDEEMSRATTRATQRSFGTNIGVAMTGVEVRKRTTKEGGDHGDNVFVVGYEGEADTLNPHNWSFATRISAT